MEPNADESIPLTVTQGKNVQCSTRFYTLNYLIIKPIFMLLSSSHAVVVTVMRLVTNL